MGGGSVSHWSGFQWWGKHVVKIWKYEDSLLNGKQYVYKHDMMTSSNGNIFRVTGPLCGEFTSDR